MLARRQEQPGAPHPVGIELLDDHLVEERPQLLLHVREVSEPVER